MSSESLAIAKTRDWVQRVVVGLNLCPFARPTLDNNTLRIVAESASDEDVLFHKALQEIDLLQRSQANEIATTLLVFNQGLGEFQHYLNFVDMLNLALREAGLEGILQIASFHPDYCFANSDVLDPANYSNRSPYPMVHFIREDELERVILAYPNPERIPQNNIQCLRGMGVDAIKSLLEGAENE